MRIRCFSGLLVFALLLAAVAGAMAESAGGYGPGLSRAPRGNAYAEAGELAEQLHCLLTDGMPLYAPAQPQPMNAYMVSHAECHVGIDGDGMYRVSDVGLVPEIADRLAEWIVDVEEASHHLIRFVDDPNFADVLICARQTYSKYGDFTGDGLTAEGYQSTVTLAARQLTNTENACSFSITRQPQETVTLRGGGRFWIAPPTIGGVSNLNDFVDTILGWYGLGAAKGSRGDAVKAIQKSLVERGYLADKIDGSFGPKAEAAVMQVQQAYALAQTGVVDAKTLVAIYYDRQTFDEVFGE